ncbi:Amidophosphoribosyltransferase [Mesorhizobium escarrei]|uniref:Amidophosphoribosyltransferase n=1 Tax=Mesorhizobium escarrei TaxID=666018 RepID=A0ABM9DS19_9HYPH|nr:Amidophosphoribosyltransferase [Mesorhizobium escarrei]
MAKFIPVDSLGFLSIDGLYRALGETARENKQPQFCDACFTAEYPTRLLDQEGGQRPALSNCRRMITLASQLERLRVQYEPRYTARPESEGGRRAKPVLVSCLCDGREGLESRLTGVGFSSSSM